MCSEINITCTVRIVLHGYILVEIVDDGNTLQEHTAQVGMGLAVRSSGFILQPGPKSWSVRARRQGRLRRRRWLERRYKDPRLKRQLQC